MFICVCSLWRDHLAKRDMECSGRAKRRRSFGTFLSVHFFKTANREPYKPVNRKKRCRRFALPPQSKMGEREPRSDERRGVPAVLDKSGLWTNQGIHRIHGKRTQREGAFLSPQNSQKNFTGTGMSPLLGPSVYFLGRLGTAVPTSRLAKRGMTENLKLETPLESHAFVFFGDSLDGEHEGGGAEIDHVVA